MENKHEYFNVDIEGTPLSLDIPAFEIEHTDDLLEPDNKQVMFEAILTSAFIMEDQNLESVPCFIVNMAQCNVNRDSIEENLDKALEYYTELEEYEVCISINSLKKKLC